VPLYEYRCNDCGHQFEKIQSFSAPEEKECPVCKGPVEKLISRSAIQFKGSGWYASDYGKGGVKPRAESSGSESGSSEGGGKDTSSGKDSSSKDGATKGAGKDSSAAGSGSTSSGSSSSGSSEGGSSSTASSSSAKKD